MGVPPKGIVNLTKIRGLARIVGADRGDIESVKLNSATSKDLHTLSFPRGGIAPLGYTPGDRNTGRFES